MSDCTSKKSASEFSTVKHHPLVHKSHSRWMNQLHIQFNISFLPTTQKIPFPHLFRQVDVFQDFKAISWSKKTSQIKTNYTFNNTKAFRLISREVNSTENFNNRLKLPEIPKIKLLFSDDIIFTANSRHFLIYEIRKLIRS